MATAYLLASVLTLIVVLVHGQEAFPEQGNIVVVAEDSFEDELNSFTDLILPGSANTRAECIQKKKCKNKGGTCQNKGNTCPGKFVKGCSKGCSCCLPEEISCKPSKRCKRANGACIARGECNGKIISTGCKKPRSCKKTHVCCVQDETTTEVPTCRGPSCPLPDNGCPNSKFTDNYVCSKVGGGGCTNVADAKAFVERVNTAKVTPYTVFSNKDFKENNIDYKKEGDDCQIKYAVFTWECNLIGTNWKCNLLGYCTGKSKENDGAYISHNCPCPSPSFRRKHLCPKCQNGDDAIIRMKEVRPDDKTPLTVFGNKKDITFDTEKVGEKLMCIINNGAITGWDVIKDASGNWAYVDLGPCTNVQSMLTTGHLEHKSCVLPSPSSSPAV